jgi:hypothetical protein
MKKNRRPRDEAECLAVSNPVADHSTYRTEESVRTTRTTALDQIGRGVPPKSALGKAIGYSLSQWPKLVRYLDHPEIPPDNNRVEQAIRPFAVGRAAWMFCDTQLGARASANLYSLVSTCQVNSFELLAYLTYLYTHLPSATTLDQLEALFPWNVKPISSAPPKHILRSVPLR